MPAIIKPTISRKVWFQPNGVNVVENQVLMRFADQPMDATVICVWDERCVNLRVTDHAGYTHRIGNVILLQEDDEPPAEGTHYATWMPFQLGQAKAVADVGTTGERHAH